MDFFMELLIELDANFHFNRIFENFQLAK